MVENKLVIFPNVKSKKDGLIGLSLVLWILGDNEYDHGEYIGRIGPVIQLVKNPVESEGFTYNIKLEEIPKINIVGLELRIVSMFEFSAVKSA